VDVCFTVCAGTVWICKSLQIIYYSARNEQFRPILVVLQILN
jgi:hypothetical protein